MHAGMLGAAHTIVLMSEPAFILWRWIDRPGHDAARLSESGDGWRLEGSAVFVHEAQPVRLDYVVVCDAQWRTRSANVTGWVGRNAIDVEIAAGSGEWTLNGVPQPSVGGCTDVDLNFSPCTNLLPIRRMSLAVGEHASIRAAWLRFPAFTLEPLDQTYTRLGEAQYQYESGGGRFQATITLNGADFAVDYAGIWRAVAWA